MLNNKILTIPNFHYNIFFTDEATFTTNGVVSSQNLRHWSHRNPNWIIQCKSQYSYRVNVWCGILGNRIFGPVFLNSLNTIEFLNFLNNEVENYLDDLPLDIRRQLYFQLDGAPAHSARPITNWLNNRFGQKWIGRNGPIHWPARSSDLTPLDFYFWERIKNLVYFNKPNNIEELKNRIREAVQKIDRRELNSVMRELRKRILKCINLNGGHIE